MSLVVHISFYHSFHLQVRVVAMCILLLSICMLISVCMISLSLLEVKAAGTHMSHTAAISFNKFAAQLAIRMDLLPTTINARHNSEAKKRKLRGSVLQHCAALGCSVEPWTKGQWSCFWPYEGRYGEGWTRGGLRLLGYLLSCIDLQGFEVLHSFSCVF